MSGSNRLSSQGSTALTAPRWDKLQPGLSSGPPSNQAEKQCWLATLLTSCTQHTCYHGNSKQVSWRRSVVPSPQVTWFEGKRSLTAAGHIKKGASKVLAIVQTQGYKPRGSSVQLMQDSRVCTLVKAKWPEVTGCWVFSWWEAALISHRQL